jgi:hypothetical protein
VNVQPTPIPVAYQVGRANTPDGWPRCLILASATGTHVTFWDRDAMRRLGERLVEEAGLVQGEAPDLDVVTRPALYVPGVAPAPAPRPGGGRA